MTRLSAHLDAQRTGRNPIDEPKTAKEAQLAYDATDTLLRVIGPTKVSLRTVGRHWANMIHAGRG